MKGVRNVLLGTTLGTAAVALSAMTASAAIACTGTFCWHTKVRYEYPAGSRVAVHEDNWKWGPSERYTWRQHEGRGYWAGDKWIEF